LDVILSIEKYGDINIAPMKFAPDYVAKRAIFARQGYSRVKIEPQGAVGEGYYLGKNCEIRK
jgi:hypothetical protein